MNLSLESFDPTKAELTTMAEAYSGLYIFGVDDVEGYQKVKEAKKELQSVRVRITKKGKEMRDDAIKFQRDVIAFEKELISIIEPTERELESRKEAVDLQKERAARLELLPVRKERLASVNDNATDEQILDMDAESFEAYFNNARSFYLDQKQKEVEEKERLAREEEERLERELARVEQEKVRAAELEKAREEAAAQALENAEKEKQLAVIRERERMQEELAAKEHAAATKEKEEKEAKEKLEAKKKFTAFLEGLGCTEATKHEYKIEWEGKTATVYKKLGSITL